MSYIFSILSGIVQGLTEFLPVSSSAHLIIFHQVFGFNFVDNLIFDVILHLGTLVALLIFFWSDVIKLIKAWFSSLKNLKCKNNNQYLAWIIIVATIPAVVIGYFFNDIIEIYFRHASIIAITLVLVALIFFALERKPNPTGGFEKLNIKKAIWIGLAQACALIPGVSRSGITTATAMSQGLSRHNSARFSFLLSIPIVFGVGLKKVLELDFANLGNDNLIILILGFLSSAIVGYVVVKYLLKFLQNHSLKIFAWYRIILALLIVILSGFWGC